MFEKQISQSFPFRFSLAVVPDLRETFRHYAERFYGRMWVQGLS
jgi:hypothetical protein